MFNATFFVIGLAIYIGIAILYVRKRKRLKITGLKSLISPLCYFGFGLLILLSLWLDLLNLFTTALLFVLLAIGIYFSQYMQLTKPEV